MQTSEWNLRKEKAAIANYNFNYPLRSTSTALQRQQPSQSPVADASKRSDGFLCATANGNGAEWKEWRGESQRKPHPMAIRQTSVLAEMANGKGKSSGSEISEKRTNATTQ